MKFGEVTAIYGEEVAINVIIATDPDCWVPTEEEFAQARPAVEADPDLVNAYMAGKSKGPDTVNVENTSCVPILATCHCENADRRSWHSRSGTDQSRGTTGPAATRLPRYARDDKVGTREGKHR